MTEQTRDGSDPDVVDEDTPPAVGRADADEDAVRSGARSGGPVEAIKNAGRAVFGDERKHDDDGVPVGRADLAADMEASGADPDRL